jgi:hypothetical protein
MEASRFLLSTGEINRWDFAGVINSEFAPTARDIYARLSQLRELHEAELPAHASSALVRFLSRNAEYFREKGSGLNGWDALQFLVGSLAAFRTEFDFLVRDNDAIARSLTLRAFLHLQRSITVAEDLASRWQAAFKKGETACEKLGAVHLLAHGIWAFKADAKGERTDLVLGQPFEVSADVRASGEAMVLTEWKLIRTAEELEPQAEKALAQARRYSGGILAGFELATTRFLVLVSEKHVECPHEHVEAGVTYRYLNVAVAPAVPSR